jgi:hypothetical protein
MHFRNAMFRFIGHFTIKDWVKHNCNMTWLVQPNQRAGTSLNKAKCTY